ncbi:MAG: HAMP domain-containing histidine kinase [Candidatus Sumerlaeia bacterium]|nr:HAMP domain-containing histidine kinase [Candidatus Sumerlaeia bacterium]
MAMKSLPDSRRTARLAQVALLLLGLYALLLNLAILGFSRYTFLQQERTQLDFLELTATNLTDPPRTYFDFIEFLWDEYTGVANQDAIDVYQESLDWQTLESALRGAVRGPVLSATLLSPRGDVLLQSPIPGENAGGNGVVTDMEMEAILRGYEGEHVVISAEPGEPVRRLYVPIVGTLSMDPVAVLRLESTVVDPGVIRRVRGRFVAGGILATLIVVILWISTMRLVRRTLEAEREAARADRLRALGTLTAGVSHEIRNPLGIISLQAEELKALAGDLPEEETRRSFESLADDLRSETQRLRKLLEDFLRFSRSGVEDEPVRHPVSPGEVIDGLMRIWSRGFDGEHRKIVYTNSAKEAMVLLPEDRLRQVVLNLLRNADDALGKKAGEIRVTLEQQGREVVLTVVDDGPGIPAEELSRIFDPFHSTRAEGTGLGLALARAIAESAGGTLEARSREGQGATFILTLPDCGHDGGAASSPSR